MPKQWCNVKHLPAQLNDENLTNQYKQHDCAESLTIFEMKSAPSRSVGSCVEHIPKLQHDENSKEEAQLVGAHVLIGANFQMEKVGHLRDSGMLKDIKEYQKRNEEKSANGQNVDCHGLGDDKSLLWKR